MTSFDCLRSGVLLERRTAGISGPERLRLEEHLASCASCRDDADCLRSLTALAAQADPQLHPARREQILERALRAQHAAPQAQVATRGWLWGMPALALCALVLLHALRPSAVLAPHANEQAGSNVQRSAAAVPAANDQQSSRVLSGEVAITAQAGAEQVLRAGASLPNGVMVVARTAAQLDTGRARLALSAGTRVAWRPQEATVHLEAGELLAQVDKDRSREFHVSTRDFVVVVTGTRFGVTLEDVRVSEGSVRVLAHDGRVLATALQAGDVWHSAGDAEAGSARGDGSTRAEVATLLDRARKLLATGKESDARMLIAQALALHPERRDRAEALSLRAEVALVAGEYPAAARGYLEVADRYRDLPAGQNALFAAARLSFAHGQTAQARTLFARYLQRYPRGRFHDEAKTRIDQLDAR